MKDKIKTHLEKSGKFLIIGKNAYSIARKISLMEKGGSLIFCNINELQKPAHLTFYSLLREPKRVVIGTIRREIILPNVIKQHCMILRKNE